MRKRIETIASMVLPSRRVIDCGCDHGYVSQLLAKRSDILKILATDISSRSIEKVEKDPWGKIETFVADGLKNLPWDFSDSIVIAGMGGALILKILFEGQNLAITAKQWILGGHSHVEILRRAFFQDLYDEKLVFEEGHFYELLEIRPGGHFFDHITEEDEFFGPLLLRRRDPLLKERLFFEKKKLEYILSKARQGRVLPLDLEKKYRMVCERLESW